jgi:hypothetical protein
MKSPLGEARVPRQPKPTPLIPNGLKDRAFAAPTTEMELVSPMGMSWPRKFNGLQLQTSLSARTEAKGFSGALTNLAHVDEGLKQMRQSWSFDLEFLEPFN